MKNTWKKRELDSWFKAELKAVLEQGELQEIFLRLLEHNGISRLDWAIIETLEVDTVLWENYVAELRMEKPVQYILGYEYFLEEKFKVNKHVLIPRPETEELVRWIASENKTKNGLKILEIGTGSGCIAIGLKKMLPLATILATDLSEQALEVASDNSIGLRLEVEFVHDDILNSQLQETDFDIIVSNPPYIPIEELSSIDSRVKDFEPNMALFTEENKPLQFYEAILNRALNSLKADGSLYFEMHEDYSQQVYDLASSKKMFPEIKKDFYGKDRMIRVKRRV